MPSIPKSTFKAAISAISSLVLTVAEPKCGITTKKNIVK